MRKVRRLLIAGILLSVACNAQDLGKNFITVTTGAGIPVGVFASKDPNSIKSGLAKNGLVINLEYIEYFKNKMGFCVGLTRRIFRQSLLDCRCAIRSGNESGKSDYAMLYENKNHYH
jgi:hypothetical protein